jgi:hypothetical protein
MGRAVVTSLIRHALGAARGSAAIHQRIERRGRRRRLTAEDTDWYETALRAAVDARSLGV